MREGQGIKERMSRMERWMQARSEGWTKGRPSRRPVGRIKILAAAVVLMVSTAAFSALGAAQVRVLSITVEADKEAEEIGEPFIRKDYRK